MLAGGLRCICRLLQQLASSSLCSRRCRVAVRRSPQLLRQIAVIFIIGALLFSSTIWIDRQNARRRLTAIAGDRKLMTFANTANWGFGNHMFAFASTLSIAAASSTMMMKTDAAAAGEEDSVVNGTTLTTGAWKVCFDRWSPLRLAFEPLADWPSCEPRDVVEMLGGKMHKERAYGKYDSQLVAELRSSHGDDHVVIDRFLQSWKYFAGREATLRRLFRFSDATRRQAHAALADAIERHVGCVGCYNDGEFIAVGVHVRRGDMAFDYRLRRQGYVTADVAYLLRAMDYFVRMLSVSNTGRSGSSNNNSGRRKRKSLRSSRLVFVVCSDDIDWCRANLESARRDVVFVSTRDAVIDMAVLAQCRHSIITVGTFGWWSAWLANGTTVYYGDWPRRGSVLASDTSRDDYFYPRWIPM